MRHKTMNNAAAMAVVVALVGAFGLPGCMDSSDPTGESSVDFLALTQQPPKPGNAPCAGVCDIDPGAGDSFRCVEVADGVESCVPAKELLCSNNADDDMDGKKDCADSDCAANPVCLPDAATCGDGNVDNGEVCDGGTGCQNDCTCPPNQVTDGSKGCKVPPAPCGNGVLDNGEVCDDKCKTEVQLPPPATEVCDNGIDDDADGDVDVSDDNCLTKTVATFSICIKAGEIATISVLAGSGESIEGNYPGAAGTGTCYPFTIDGEDGYAKVWVRSTWRKFVADHNFVVWDDGMAVSPPNWPAPAVPGIPVAGTYQSQSPGLIWVNFYVEGAN